MIKSYLPSKYNTWIIILISVLLIFKNISLATIIGIIYITLYLVLRKSRNDFRDDPISTKGVIFSPCNGKVLSIDKGISHVLYGENLTEIQIMIPWWKEMGIYLPLSAEIKNIMVHKGRSFFRYFKASEVVGTSIGKGLSIVLDNRGERIGLTLYKCRLGLWPDVMIMPGDRGGRRVNIGYFPFGGTLILYLPEKYEILVKIEEEINAGETIMAVIPDNI
jgi:phosphatidylserine decarboxylase